MLLRLNAMLFKFIFLKFYNYHFCLMLLVLSSFSLKAQNDSIKIESLYNRGEKEKYINLKASKINFENAIKLIDDNFSNGHNKSDYFSLKKTLILDRLSYYYRKEGNYALSLKTIQESLQLKKMIGEKFTLNETYHNLGRLYLKRKIVLGQCNIL